MKVWNKASPLKSSLFRPRGADFSSPWGVTHSAAICFATTYSTRGEAIGFSANHLHHSTKVFYRSSASYRFRPTAPHFALWNSSSEHKDLHGNWMQMFSAAEPPEHWSQPTAIISAWTIKGRRSSKGKGGRSKCPAEHRDDHPSQVTASTVLQARKQRFMLDWSSKVTTSKEFSSTSCKAACTALGSLTGLVEQLTQPRFLGLRSASSQWVDQRSRWDPHLLTEDCFRTEKLHMKSLVCKREINYFSS